ncbi:MAG: DNA repair protein RecO [Lachnospiraceae bacterium]|nr:DNA repair protein RecO [Lachnospiraceae bacterium]
MSSQTCTVTGIVLSAAPAGEYDKLVVLLTKERGKIRAFARGARRMNSPLLAAANVFAFGEFQIYEGRTSNSISQASIQNYFSELMTDFEGACYGQYFLEFADYYTRENADCMDFLRLTYQSLRALSVPSLSRTLVRYIYEMKAMVYSGECPYTFEQFESWNLNLSTLYALQYVVSSPVEKLYTFTLSEDVCAEFGKVVTWLRERYVDRRFKSLEILESCL